MMCPLRPYPVYKASGVEWLGKVPEHWQMVPNRAVLRLKKELVGSNSDDYLLLSLTKQGVVTRDMENPEGKFPAQFDSYQVIEPGDLIFCLFDIDETPRTVGLSSLHGMITGAYTRFVCADETTSRFVYLLYVALDNRKHLKPLYTGLRKVISKSTFLSAKMPLPSPREQAAIVRFLDHADRRIRRYIRAKQKLITLLEEQKQAIIHRAVTRGLGPNVRLKPSGVEWLGDVPTHWRVARLKDVADIQTGLTLGKNYRGSVTESYPYLRVANVQSGHLDLDHVKRLDVPRVEAQRATLQAGDVLMTEGGDIDKLGRGCVWRGEIAGCLHQNHVFVVRCQQKYVLSEFLMGFMASQIGRRYFQLTAKQTTNLASTNSRTLRAFPMSFPPVGEQEELLRAVSGRTTDIDRATDRAQREINLLREYRTRLIADVVTGKLDVRDAAARLSDEAEEPGPLDEAEAIVNNGEEEPAEVEG